MHSVVLPAGMSSDSDDGLPTTLVWIGKSGNGRELGPSGLAEYQELKHIWQNTAPKPKGCFGTRNDG